MSKIQMECKACDVTWDLPKAMCTTFTNGVQRWSANKEVRVDLCPKCGKQGTDVETNTPVTAPNLSFTDSGTGKTVVK